MKPCRLLKSILVSLISISLLTPAYANADWERDDRTDRRSDNLRDGGRSKRSDNLRDGGRSKRPNNRIGKRRTKVRRGNRLVVVTPRRRTFRNIIVVRPHGHAYHGYGHFLHDDNAWKWLAFTAITLKVLDMIDEQAQREHEAAQVKAATAPIGEKIVWETESSSGYVVATKKGTNASGLTCREFQQEIKVGGETENAYGTACLQADGAWKISP